MAAHNDQKIITLLKKYPKTFCEEIGIKLTNSPSALFQWFYSSNLFSARIGSNIAVEAAKGLRKAGWTSASKMASTNWDQRVKVLNEAGYARYQERTATFLGDFSEKLLEKYHGDLRNLKEEAGNDPSHIRSLLKEFKGEGDVGVDIFFREAQQVWQELFPFLDKKSAAAAKKFKLPTDAEKLAGMVSRKDYIHLMAALVKAGLNNDYDLESSGQKKAETSSENKGLSSRPKRELYDLAREKNIPGRSQMNKQQLIRQLEG